MKTAIVGMGKFGHALTTLLEENGLSVERVTRHKLMSEPATLVFLSVPTQELRKALTRNRKHLEKSTVLINCSKGIEEHTHLLPFQIVQQIAPTPDYASLTGPSFAAEIMKREPTVVSLGCSNTTSAQAVKASLETPFFKVSVQKGYQDLELSGALKNVYAILSGYAHGLGLGANTRVRIILQARRELAELARAIGYPTTNLDAPGVLGDLILTCTSRESRNYAYGVLLAKTHVTNPLESTRKTIEGFYTSHSVAQLVDYHNIEAPLIVAAADLTSGKSMKVDKLKKLLSNLYA